MDDRLIPVASPRASAVWTTLKIERLNSDHLGLVVSVLGEVRQIEVGATDGSTLTLRGPAHYVLWGLFLSMQAIIREARFRGETVDEDSYWIHFEAVRETLNAIL
jgi:hypothetical protein